MRPFDLVVLDLDGTILNAYQRTRISKAVHDAIEAVQAAGVPVTIGTGRTLDYIRYHLPGDLHLTYPVIATQGAVIGDPVSGRVLVEIPLPLKEARAIAAFVDDHRYTTAFYFNNADGHTVIYQNAAGATAEEEALLIDERHMLDLSEVVRQYILLQREQYPLCDEACAGLCPVCGQNLNEGPCGCRDVSEDPRWAALRELLQ